MEMKKRLKKAYQERKPVVILQKNGLARFGVITYCGIGKIVLHCRDDIIGVEDLKIRINQIDSIKDWIGDALKGVQPHLRGRTPFLQNIKKTVVKVQQNWYTYSILKIKFSQERRRKFLWKKKIRKLYKKIMGKLL